MDLSGFDTITNMLRSFSNEEPSIDMLLQQSGDLDSFMASLNTTNDQLESPNESSGQHTHSNYYEDVSEAALYSIIL